MPKTRTPGITVYADGQRILDKEYRGVRIYARLGHVSQLEAEQSLREAIERTERELQHKACPRFLDCAVRYLAESRFKRSAKDIERHIRLLIAYLGDLEIDRVHDGTIAPFVADRLAEGVSATTINRSLEVVRTILNRAARCYRDANGRPLLSVLPPLITMLPESRRQPYPITWEEQDRLFPLLPPHLGRMVLFAVNTGLRDGNVCGLMWRWEVPVPEVGRSVFVIPPEAFKSNRIHVVILNDVAWSIVQAQRGKHPVWVFPYRGRRVNHMNNTSWKKTRARAGLPSVRIHDLRHTFATRLRAAGVPAEDRNALLGHATSAMSDYYASADIGHLLKQANRILDRAATRTVLRVVNG
jgi:integrase